MTTATTQAKLVFHGVDIINLHFNFFKPVVLEEAKNKVNLKVTPKVFYPKDKPNIFVIVIDVIVGVEECFELNVTGLGHFQLTSEITEIEKKTFINTNAPAIMFPYIRAFITTISAHFGENFTSPIVLPPQFFQGEIEEEKDLQTVEVEKK